jgi:hypothetical protein
MAESAGVSSMDTGSEFIPETGTTTTVGNRPPPINDPLPRLKPKQPERYNGKRNYTTVENFITMVDSFFALTRAEPPQVYYYLSTLFIEDAAIWFRYNFPSTTSTMTTWPMIREQLRSYFIPPNKDKRILDQWASLEQRGSVQDYINDFCSLVMQLPSGTPSEAILTDKFIRGLKPKTRVELELKNPMTVNEAFTLADRYDTIVYQRKLFNFTPMKSRSIQRMMPEYDDRGEPMQIDAIGTRRPSRQRPARTSEKIPQRITTEDRIHLSSIGACFKCRQPGHMMRECPAVRLIPQKSRQSGKGNRQL